MSYILDALRKSESERHQGKVPDLGRQLQMIHRPAKRRWPLQALLATGLLLNAGVLAYIFWPTPPVSAPVGDESVANAGALPAKETAATKPGIAEHAAMAEPENLAPAASQPLLSANGGPAQVAVPAYQPPTVIVPSRDRRSSAVNNAGNSTDNSANRNRVGALVSSGAEEPAGSANSVRIPHLVELPLSFQRSVPDLIVNSHIFASVPQARRVRINNQNLRPGDSVQGLRVEQITEDGVVLSKQEQRFRLGIVRDWLSPR